MDLFRLGGLRDNRTNQLYDNKLRHPLATIMIMLVAFGMSDYTGGGGSQIVY